MSKDEQIYRLFKALDDIDTASDLFKEDYHLLARYVGKLVKFSKKIVPEAEIEKLYDRFYKTEQSDES